MTELTPWKLRKNPSRISSVNTLSNLLKEDNFSKLMDTVFELAIQRLKEKDKIRREMQANIKSFKFIGEDFVW